jgi:hypothetical protein
MPKSHVTSAKKPAKPSPAKAAFDVWLERGLHELYDSVAQEPIPPSLLDLINQDREPDPGKK